MKEAAAARRHTSKDGDFPYWYEWVDQSIQQHVGTAKEFDYFSVMHGQVGKVLWRSPEHYETTMGVTLPSSFKMRE